MFEQGGITEFARPEMLRMGRLLRALTQHELAARTEIDQALISKYENGRPINDSDLKKISEILQLPEAFFRRQIPIHAPNGASMIMFRRRKTASTKVQDQVIMEMNWLRDNVRILRESVDVQGFFNIPLYEPEEGSPEEIESIAERVRLELRILPGPVKSVIRSLESMGVVIIHKELPTKVDAILDSSLVDSPIALLKDNIPGGRQRFSLAHELGHLVMHNTIKFDLDAIEEQADRFASAFLMPAYDIKTKLRKLTLERLIALSAEWQVSVQALVRRAADLDLLTDRQYRYWNVQLSQNGFRTSEPVPLPVEFPTLIESLINIHLNQLDYSVNELASVLTMEDWEFKRIYLGEKIQIVPKPQQIKPVLRPFADNS